MNFDPPTRLSITTWPRSRSRRSPSTDRAAACARVAPPAAIASAPARDSAATVPSAATPFHISTGMNAAHQHVAGDRGAGVAVIARRPRRHAALAHLDGVSFGGSSISRVTMVSAAPATFGIERERAARRACIASDAADRTSSDARALPHQIGRAIVRRRSRGSAVAVEVTPRSRCARLRAVGRASGRARAASRTHSASSSGGIARSAGAPRETLGVVSAHRARVACCHAGGADSPGEELEQDRASA